MSNGSKIICKYTEGGRLKNNIGIAILIGGRSSRMGQAKECLILEHDGKKETFLEHLCNEFHDYTYKYISENNSQDITVKGYNVVRDKYDEIGPLGGIYSVLTESETDAVLFIACDMPFISSKAAEYLIDSWDNSPACVALVNGKRQPLIGIYTKDCIPYIENQIETGNYKIGILLDNVNCRMSDMSSFEKEFVNINTVSDYDFFMESGR